MYQKMNAVAGAIILALGLQPAGTAFADTDADNRLLDILLNKGTITQQEYDELKESSKYDVDATTKGGHLKFKSASGDFKMQVGGRLMIDTAVYDDDHSDINNGTEIRRARIFVAGEVYDDWKYKSQVDFAGNDVTIKDAYIRYTGFDAANITVGNFKEPFSLEELTSSKYITFMERALPNAFAPSRKMGIGVNHVGDKLTVAGGVFADSVDADNDTEGSNSNEGYGVAGRVTFAPLKEKTRVVHLGGSVEYRDPSGNEVRYRERPESHISNQRLVDTGTLEVDDTTTWGLEAATVLGPFSLQGEYVGVSVSNKHESDADFNGWYAFASWFITGESRKYKNGVFDRVKPKSIVGKGGHGAWEVAARVSKIDLNDADVEGGEESNFTLGVNWYATPSIRFMANYVNVSDHDKGDVSDEPAVFQLRAQIDF